MIDNNTGEQNFESAVVAAECVLSNQLDYFSNAVHKSVPVDKHPFCALDEVFPRGQIYIQGVNIWGVVLFIIFPELINVRAAQKSKVEAFIAHAQHVVQHTFSVKK